MGWLALLLLSGCTDSYLPDVIKTPPGYLVVDGFINTQGVTTVKLTQAYAIASAKAPPVEAKATVYVEEENGPRYTLREAPVGTYTSPALVLNPAKKYRLHLNTLAGKEYASDFVPAKTTPPIDNLRWRVDNTELNVLVDAHDATNATRYYRWEFEETWEINPVYRPTIEYVNRVMRYIVVPFPRICYGNARSTTVQLDKTTGLTQDAVSDFRVRQLPANSERFDTRYSILVQQHALTKEEYTYWDLLRKNTESIGSLFDPQPAQLTGNVHCVTNPAEPVLGFVSAHSVVEKRIFIRRADLPNSREVLTGYERCIPPDSVSLFPRGINPPPTPDEIMFASFGGPDYLPIEPFDGVLPGAKGFYGASRDCIDCRTRGSAVKPTFW